MERKSEINNAFYDDLGEAWYEGNVHPIALLRAENAVRNPWILSKIAPGSAILDIGCGAGLLTNALAEAGHRVTGVDLSVKSLSIARQKDKTRSVSYLHQDAFSLDFPLESFDVVCAMDFLEHIDEPEEIVHKAAGFLKPGGLFFFHTFNRNLLSYLIVIKGVEWLVPNTPKNMHIYRLFIKPKELTSWCKDAFLTVKEMQGLCPDVLSWPFWKSALMRRMCDGFSFQFTTSMTTGYLGIAQKCVRS